MEQHRKWLELEHFKVDNLFNDASQNLTAHLKGHAVSTEKAYYSAERHAMKTLLGPHIVGCKLNRFCRVNDIPTPTAVRYIIQHFFLFCYDYQTNTLINTNLQTLEGTKK